MHAYATSSIYADQDVEVLYEEITTAVDNRKKRVTVISGDLNAKLGLDWEKN